MVKIAVVGGGIMGFGSAVAIQEKCPGINITIFSEKFSPETTGDGAAGLWGPYLLGDTSPKLIEEWSRKTHDLFLEIWKSQDSGKMGVTLIPCYKVSEDENEPEPEWKDVVFGFRKMTARELQRFGKPNLKLGYTYNTFICEASKLLPFLLEKFLGGGGQVVQMRITSLQSLRHDFDIVVNCTGVEAYHVVPDNSVFPIRGQVMRVEAPGIFYGLLDTSVENDGYIIANQNTVILGGTHQEGNWNLIPDSEDKNSIKKFCYKMVPSLKDAPVIKNWVGLRPGRPKVRLEMETLRFPNERKTLKIVHNYGHAGSGVTLFWGCAQHVTALVQQAILASESKL